MRMKSSWRDTAKFLNPNIGRCASKVVLANAIIFLLDNDITGDSQRGVSCANVSVARAKLLLHSRLAQLSPLVALAATIGRSTCVV